MPRSVQRTPDQQQAFRDSQKKQDADLAKRKADAKAKAAASKPKRINVTRSDWTKDL